MKTDIYFSASADIARRAGIISSRYRTKDGRFIITDKDLGRVQLVMSPEEFMNGIDVRTVTELEAKNLIADNGYQIGEEYVEEVPSVEEAPAEDAVPIEPSTEDPADEGSQDEGSQDESSEDEGSEDEGDDSNNENTEEE